MEDVIKNVKKDLRNIRHGRRELEEMLEELDVKRRRLDFLRAAGDGRASDLALCVKEYEKRAAELLSELEKKEQKYESAISNLDVLDSLVLREYVFGGKTQAEIADLLGYSVRWVEERLNRAYRTLKIKN